MDARKIALLVGALLIAAVTAFAARSMFTGSSAPGANAAAAPAQDGPEVLVATRPLPVGTILQADSFRYQPWPKDLMKSVYFIKGQADVAKLAGTVVRHEVTAGQPLTQGSLVKPGDRGFLAAALGPGMRAVTVAVDERTAAGGFVFPGDRIDLMVTHAINATDEGQALKVTETFIRNLRVLATDQRTVVEDAEGKREVKKFQTVTLEATPRMAEKIAVSRTIGELSLSLRSIADTTADLERAIASGEVKLPVGADPREEKAFLAAVAARPVDNGGSFVTGADVSRFQRGTMPSQRARPAQAAPSGGGSGSAQLVPAVTAAPRGPVVRVTRGNTVTEVPVGG